MSYSSPVAQSTGDLITSAIWNQNVVDNVVQHQADLDLNYRAVDNPIINGDFRLWQLGTAFATIADGTTTADKWLYNKSGVMVNTVQRSTTTPTAAQAFFYTPYSLELSCTTVDSSIAAGDYQLLSQILPGFNFNVFAQRGFSLSFWVRSNKTGVYCVGFRNSGADRSYVAEYTISVADTWEFKTVNVIASPSAGTWDYLTGTGLRIGFVFTCGSTSQTTPGAWQTGNFFGTSSQVNFNDSNSNVFRLWGAQIHPTDATNGISAANYKFFKPMTYGQEILRSGFDTANSRQGVFEPTPQGKFHVSSGRGTVPSLGGAEIGIFQNNDDAADNSDLLLLAGASGLARLLFGDASDPDIGRVVYDHSDNSMDLVTNNAVAATFNSSGDIDVTRYTNPGGRTITGTMSTGSLANGASTGTLFTIAVSTAYLIFAFRDGALDMSMVVAHRQSGGTGGTYGLYAGGAAITATAGAVVVQNGSGGVATYTLTWIRIY